MMMSCLIEISTKYIGLKSNEALTYEPFRYTRKGQVIFIFLEFINLVVNNIICVKILGLSTVENEYILFKLLSR